MAVGGLAVQPKTASAIEARLQEIRKECGFFGRTSEVEWKSANRRKDNIYKAYIDFLFELVEKDAIHVHIRFTPSNGKKIKPQNVSKAFYQLFLHRSGRYYHSDCNILILPDDGCCTDYLPKMRTGLNNDIIRKFSGVPNVVRDISPQNSRNQPILQLLDVTLGAMTCIRNEKHLNGGVGDFKKQLAEYAMERSSINSIAGSSPISRRQFNIWNVK